MAPKRSRGGLQDEGANCASAVPKSKRTKAEEGQEMKAAVTVARTSGRVRTAPASAAASTAVAASPPPKPTGPYKPSAPTKAVAALPVDPSAPQRDSRGAIRFADAPDFRPRLTPAQVIRAGSFGGCYFHPQGGKPGLKPGVDIAVDHLEFPAEWFAGLGEHMYRSRRYNVPTNRFKVKSGQGQKEWEEQGWIRAQDPRGWFQWYCRFYLGRRTGDDERQISRWYGVCGPKGRWKRALLNKIVGANAAWDDAKISPVIRQTLLHWAYEVDAKDVEDWAAGKR